MKSEGGKMKKLLHLLISIRALPGSGYFPVLLIGAFVIRLIGAASILGHPIDYADFTAWADHAYSAGLASFYTGNMFVDYPPGYIYVLYVIGMVRSWLSIGGSPIASAMLLKLPAMLADLAMACLVYTTIRKQRVTSGRKAPLLALLVLFNPSVYIDSVLWAQIDSIYTLTVMLLLFALMKSKLPQTSAWWIVSVLIKPQAVIFAPLLLFALMKRKSGRTWLYSAAAGAAVFVLAVLPFSLHQQPLWIVQLYKSMFASYPYAALNAANLYTLFGFNGALATGKWLILPMQAWGDASIAVVVAIAAWLFYTGRDASKYVYSAFLISLLVFVFKTGMHERYGYPAVLLSLLSYVYIRDKRTLFLFAALSLTQFANMAYVLAFSLKQVYWIPSGDSFMKLISLCNVALALYAVYVGRDIYVKGRIRLFQPTRPHQHRSRQPGPGKSAPARSAAKCLLPNVPLTLTPKDTIVMTAITLLYTALALYQLGALRAPQTYWQPQRAAESFYADFGRTENVAGLLWYGGIGDAEFQIAQSSDAKTWTPVQSIQLSGGTVFQWKRLPDAFAAQYVRIDVTQPGAALYELAFVDDRKQPLPISKLVPVNMNDAELSAAHRLFDEQGTVPEQPSFLNSMYFDEIYHARTAYENLHHMEPYETTHPPLGKILISLGVAIFGMNPLGWRIVGTLFGAAMIPLMYVWAKNMLGRSSYGFIAAFLLACDFMHFTQTRIATIDVYGVFFIMLMYIFMYRYYALSLNRAPLRRTLLPLGLAGLSFGIGAACKWIDLYAGAGLAVILAITLYETCLRGGSYRQYWRPFWLTIGWCCVMFVAVPAAIYTLSYIPFLQVPGPGHDFRGILAAQQAMYRYHTTLVATHPFSSAWWEWPLMRRPIWYYGQTPGVLPPGLTSSIVALGNPAVWWVGTVAAGLTCCLGWRRKDTVALFLLIGLAAEYVPWVGVPRLTFIYHFFASVPFLIGCIVYVIKSMQESGSLPKRWLYAYLSATLLLFILFYPVLSGAVVSRAYVDHVLRWFPSWIF
jgi:Gpi18-like mannosyltransferase